MWREGKTFEGLKIVKVWNPFLSRVLSSLIHVQVGTLDDPKALEGLKPGVELYAPTRVEWVSAVPDAEQVNGMPS